MHWELNKMIREPLDEDLAAKFIYESNLIENIDINLELLMLCIHLGHKKGHSAALLFLENCLKNNFYWSKSLLFQIHKLIIEEQNTFIGIDKIPDHLIGKYRDVDVEIGTDLGVEYELINEKMDDLNAEINYFQASIKRMGNFTDNTNIENILEIIANLHFTFEKIHPFVDGNGRTGRLLVWYLMRFTGLTPFIFTSADKGNTYYKAFRCQNAMRTYFKFKYANI